ncbi:nitroreductase [Streptomyces sp. NPDC000594]|uniref:nitroreductase n=1 Tax=Streptomyces sp. NPDC000594 TaxID=3154261 RepID=UPI003326A3DF
MRSRPSPVTAALARARSGEVPGPDLPWPERARPSQAAGVAVPAVLDPLLRHSVAGGRLRPAASAGALHPVTVRILAGADSGLPPGEYTYEPGAHRLHLHRPRALPAPPGTLALLIAAPERTVAHYRHRAWPLVLLDTGHTAAALVAAGAAAHTPDAVLAGPGHDGGVPLAAVRLTGAARLADWPATTATTADTEPAPGDHPDLVHARRILRLLAAAGTPHGTWHTAPARTPRSVIRDRRSAPLETLAAAERPSETDLLRVIGAAHAATPGGPRWWLATGGTRPALRVLRAGRLATGATGPVLPTLAAWAAGQGWLATTGAVLLSVGCPGDAGPARIRRDHLLAGYGAGHAHLMATALGLAARPVGCWQNADLGAALGGEPGREWIVHGLALGAPPRHRARPAHPPAPDAGTPKERDPA